MDSIGDQSEHDSNEIFGVVYDELRRLANTWWQDQTPGQTIQPTALVHEAYLKIAQGRVRFKDEEHFRAIAAKAMRQALIQHFRSKNALKRSPRNLVKVTLSGIESDQDIDPTTLLAIDEAISTLEKLDERKARIIEMRFFAGMSEEEIARVLGVSSRTIRSDWRMARAWLSKHLSDFQTNMQINPESKDHPENLNDGS